MKTVQEWLREKDAENIIAAYLINHPIDFLMLHNKDMPYSDRLLTINVYDDGKVGATSSHMARS